MRIACADRQDRAHARLARALNHFRAIRVERLTVDMRVRIYEHGN
jgi:hypothetical protein